MTYQSINCPFPNSLTLLTEDIAFVCSLCPMQQSDWLAPATLMLAISRSLDLIRKIVDRITHVKFEAQLLNLKNFISQLKVCTLISTYPFAAQNILTFLLDYFVSVLLIYWQGDAQDVLIWSMWVSLDLVNMHAKWIF